MSSARESVLKNIADIVYLPIEVNSFELTHHDYDSQNFIVSQDYALECIIDWNRVASAPSSMSKEIYSKRIARD